MGGEPFDPKIFEKINTHGEPDHVQTTRVDSTVALPGGVWVDVRAGQRTAEGTVTRPEWPGLLFDADDPEKVVCWHLSPKVFTCNRTNIKPAQVVLEEGSNAPWCPTCLSKKKEIAKASKVKGRRKQKRMFDEIKQRNAFKGMIRGLNNATD